MVAEFIAGYQFPLGQGKANATAALETLILPALGPADAPTPKGLAFESVMRNLTGGPRPFFREGYRKSFAFNFGLATGDPDREMVLTRAGTNEDADYQADPGLGFDGDVLNRGVRRFAADPSLRDVVTHPDTAPTTGRLEDPLLTLHETGDLTVPITAERSYREKVERAGSGDFLVQRIVRDGCHCEFRDQEITRAWEDLVAWVVHHEKPDGDDVTGDLQDAGRTFTNPLRPGDPGQKR
jgi:hypothetical protein